MEGLNPDQATPVERMVAKIGIGVIAYDSYEAKKIIGKKSKEIKFILGYDGRDELIHKDDLVKINI